MRVKHVVPVDDWIEHDDRAENPTDDVDECICGPKWRFVQGGALVVHQALDGREPVA